METGRGAHSHLQTGRTDSGPQGPENLNGTPADWRTVQWMSVTDRARHQIALYGQTVSIVLLLVGVLAAGGAAYVYLTPGVEEVPAQQVDVQDFEASVEHSAVVVNGTGLFDEGQRLRNQPRYFFRSTPVLELSAVAEVPDDRPVTVSHRLVLDIVARTEQDIFGERQRVLASGEGTVEDGRFVVNTTLNVSSVVAEVNGFQDEVGSLGSVAAVVRLETTYATESTQGGTYEGTLGSASRFRFVNEGYWIDGNLSASTTESTTVGGGVRQQDANMALVGGLGALGVVALALGGVFAYWNSRTVDLEELKMQLDRSRYSEWISEGDFPSGQDRQYVYIETIEDLVDVAIDINKRVIYDPEIGTYAVTDGDIVYYHAADPRSVSSWLDLS